MTTVTKRDGTKVSWTGLGLCWCHECEELFNSVSAFDKHLVGKGRNREGGATHRSPETLGMVRNAKGYWCLALMPSGVSRNTIAAKNGTAA